MPVSNNQIQQVRDLIREGKKKQAIPLLANLIERDHDNPELWWLLANATSDYHQARRALEEVLSLNPNDDRAQKMLDRIETRQLLRQMGVTGHNASPRPSARRRTLLFALGGLAGVIILLAAVMAITRLNGTALGDLDFPTMVAFATEAPTTEPVEVVTEEPTSQPTDFAPERTGEAVAALATETTLTEEATERAVEPTDEIPQPTEDFSSEGDNGLVLTVEVAPPTTQPLINAPPESTAEVIPTTLPLGDAPAATALSILPEGTAEAVPQGDAQPTEAGLPAAVAAIEPVTDMRGQVLDGQARRDIIAPYGLQGWTFSGYRGEKITLELISITGSGNPSLELRNEANQVVASDIDLTSGNNIDSLLEVTLPSDGVYTVVVRMAAVEEQLYSLKLTRG